MLWRAIRSILVSFGKGRGRRNTVGSGDSSKGRLIYIFVRAGNGD